jgi:thiamine-phosphate pyrophosphorylase
LKHLPRLYPILDADALSRVGVSLETAALALYNAGLRWVQYRDKTASDEEVIARTHLLRSVFHSSDSTVILNDRVHLYAATRADGIHIGQQDLAPAEARRRLGPNAVLGVSTHNLEQLRQAVATGAASYLAIGPVYSTASKRDPDPVVSLEGVRTARALTQLPLVAIGGITEENAAAVIQAGADAVAVISALLPVAQLDMAERVRDFLAVLI